MLRNAWPLGDLCMYLIHSVSFALGLPGILACVKSIEGKWGFNPWYPPREGHPSAVFVGNWPFFVLSGMCGLSVRPLGHFTHGRPDPCRKGYLGSGELNTGQAWALHVPPSRTCWLGFVGLWIAPGAIRGCGASGESVFPQCHPSHIR